MSHPPDWPLPDPPPAGLGSSYLLHRPTRHRNYGHAPRRACRNRNGGTRQKTTGDRGGQRPRSHNGIASAYMPAAFCLCLLPVCLLPLVECRTVKTQFHHAYVMVVMSDDHPGIISAVSSDRQRPGRQHRPASQTVVGGYFTLIMVVSLPAPVRCRCPGAPRSAARRRRLAAGGGAAVTSTSAAGPAPVERFVVTAFGKDKPGIIAHFSRYLAGKDINITDFYWNRSNDRLRDDGPGRDSGRADFGIWRRFGGDRPATEGFTVKLQHENVFVATNQLRLTRDLRCDVGWVLWTHCPLVMAGESTHPS